jgi:hypothetical protein
LVVGRGLAVGAGTGVAGGEGGGAVVTGTADGALAVGAGVAGRSGGTDAEPVGAATGDEVRAGVARATTLRRFDPKK